MPKEYFQVQNCATLNNTLKVGDTVHVLGVCGVAMAPLAVLLCKMGYKVIGTDREYYEPMASVLKRAGVKTITGYSAKNISKETKLAVIGNSISYGNEEVLEIEKRKLVYTFFSKLLYETIIEDKKSIVIAGTHGKSTTTALTSFIFKELELLPSYFVGAEVQALGSSLHKGQGDLCVVEGDEYDSAFFAKVPKFTFYKANIFLITSIEFDHADIYNSLEEIVKQFTEEIQKLKKDDFVVCCLDSKTIKDNLSEWKKLSEATFITYGINKEADIKVISRETDDQGLQCISLESEDFGDFKCMTVLSGAYNANNIAGIFGISQILMIDKVKLAAAISRFKGLKRRQEEKFDNGGITVIEDFAHHPTAVKETILGIKEKYPNRPLLAIFEPRSNTSRREIFKDDYINAFLNADQVILSEVKMRDIDAGLKLLKVSDLVDEMRKKEIKASCFETVEEITENVIKNIKKGDLILVMSNGSFGGLVTKLTDGLNKRNL